MRLPATFTLLAATLLAGSAVASGGTASQPAGPTLDQKFPGQTAGCLGFARLEQLPAGVLLRSGDLTVTAKELDAEIARAHEDSQAQLRQNALLVLQGLAHERLLIRAAYLETGSGAPPASQPDQAVLDSWLKPALGSVKLAPAEVEKFYADNEPMFGGEELAKVRADIERYLLQVKQSRAVREHIRTIGQRVPIVLSAEWVAEQQKLSADNPLDRLRANGKPTLVNFGAAGCCGPDKMAGVLEAVGEQFENTVNVLFVNVREHPFLADRFGIEDVPTQILLDKSARTLFRNEGAIGEQELARRVRAETGVK